MLVWPNGTATEPVRSSSYGPRQPIWTGNAWTRPFHVGTDHHSIGTIRSIGAGTVIESGDGGWAGWYVLVYLGEVGGVRTWVRYCHLAARSHLNRGDQVSLGDVIGREGETGDTDGVHLHWEISRGRVDRGSGGDPGSTIDPRAFIIAHLTNTPTGQEEAEDMKYAMRYTEGGVDYVIVGETSSGWAYEYTTRDTKFNNLMIKNFGFKEIMGVDKSIYNAFKRSLAEVRQGK